MRMRGKRKLANTAQRGDGDDSVPPFFNEKPEGIGNKWVRCERFSDLPLFLTDFTICVFSELRGRFRIFQ